MGTRSPGTPTLEEVAAHAGVGRGTVSRVINNAAGVKDSTRRAVQQAIDELGYVPNLAARSLAGQRSNAVALVLTEPDWRVFAEPFFSEIVRSLGDALADIGMQLMLTLVRSDADRKRFLEYARGSRVDGVLLLSVHAGDRLPDMLAEARLPTVMLGRRSGDEYVSYVDADNLGGARSAVSHLVSRGRRTIATITGPLDMDAAQCRLRGYQDALALAGLDSEKTLVAEGDFTQDSGHRAMTELLERRPDIDGVLAASDTTAAGALQALRAAGRRVPQDVAVIGFDDFPLAQRTEPRLTTVRQPLEEMGRAMIRLLLDDMEEPSVAYRHVILRTALVVREST
ncbi:LacI family transcriptional regulator [Streptomyces sp. NBC_00285]|uniref:LacI family DNA-binding transcriptional regulator n=1 Tax=Streptomyces sp. NBC_00285 TaxID=2975700 RepID=UPI002E2DCDF9|nr:LacI family DNA-binding transcriptional regulator [Streptomyces sp. NBC_00285]